MVKRTYTWAVSAQPWPDGTAPQLAATFSGLGFDGVEIPVRDGFPVTPANVGTELAAWSKVLADSGLKITSVTGEPSAELFDVCAANGIPVIRTMAMIASGGYPEGVSALQAKFAGWKEQSRSTGVRMAVQQHHGPFVSTTSGLTGLLAPLDAATIGAAWDAGHSGLAGEQPQLAVTEIAERLVMVNLRNAHYENAPEWPAVWVPGPDGMSDWAAVGAALGATDFDGTICLAAQYSDAKPDVATAVGKDLAYARSVFEV